MEPLLAHLETAEAAFERLNQAGAVALDAVVAARLDQIARGHDAEADALRPIDWFAREAAKFAGDAVDFARGINGERDLKRARRRLAQAAALCLAGIDRLDAAGAAK